MTRPLDPACAVVRESIHLRLDGEPLAVEAEAALEAHLAHCGACRGFASELGAIQERLRGLPELGLADAALDEVWRRTAPAPGRRAWWLAAAASVGLLLGGLWLYRSGESSHPSPRELERASREARMVLRLAGQALQRTENVAIHAVLTEEVSGTLRRVPIEWPEPRAAEERNGS